MFILAEHTVFCNVECSNGPAAKALTEISEPAIDWNSLAMVSDYVLSVSWQTEGNKDSLLCLKGFSIPASRVKTAEELASELAAALERDGPSLIEAVI